MNLTNRFVLIIAITFGFSMYGVTSDKLSLKAYNAIYDNALTSVRGECLSFDIDESHANYYFVTVKENHTKTKCHGDDNVSNRMFDMKIYKKTGLIYTNEGSDAGVFRKLKSNNAQCGKLNNIATQKADRISAKNPEYKVSAGRSYFYTAPDEKCKNKDLFIVKNDLINAYLNYKNFSFVIYYKKNGDNVSGWIHSDSVKPVVTSINPTGK